MRRPEPVAAAKSLVAERFPDAVQAWLGGSVAFGRATATSDLDITVLRTETEVYRESLTYEDWPVELFVHTASSIRHFVEQDIGQRKPTTARLIASGISLLDGNGGKDLAAYCADVLASGPNAPDETGIALARYYLTDLRDDLEDAPAISPATDALVVWAWTAATELLLTVKGRWLGGGKWRIREIEAMDAEEGSDYAARFHAVLHEAMGGDCMPLIALVDDVLAQAGGAFGTGSVSRPACRLGSDRVPMARVDEFPADKSMLDSQPALGRRLCS